MDGASQSTTDTHKKASWWPGADKSAGSRFGARSDPNEVRARAMDGPQPINHRHADFQ
jgi:hypothetical protein